MRGTGVARASSSAPFLASGSRLERKPLEREEGPSWWEEDEEEEGRAITGSGSRPLGKTPGSRQAVTSMFTTVPASRYAKTSGIAGLPVCHM